MFDYPLLFSPVYKDYIWGGTWIINKYSRSYRESICAESWELSDRNEGMSVVENGALKGLSLRYLMQQYPNLFSSIGSSFPLLYKLIDAKENLSIQVHPNILDSRGGEPKTEMWYILDAKPNAMVYVGFNQDMSEDKLRQVIHNNTLEHYLNPYPVKTGDIIYIPGGTVHAIGKGCLVYEVQQNSNTTYRLYDWGRVNHKGETRPLHIDSAIEILHREQSKDHRKAAILCSSDNKMLLHQVCTSPYFSVYTCKITREYNWKNTEKKPCVFFASHGSAHLISSQGVDYLPYGRSCLIPATCLELKIKPETDFCEFICSWL